MLCTGVGDNGHQSHRATKVIDRVPGQLSRQASLGQRQLASTESRGYWELEDLVCEGQVGWFTAEDRVDDFARTGMGRWGALLETED